MKTTVRILGVFIILLILFASAASIWRAERDKTELRESQAAIAEAQQSLALLKEEAKNMTGESKVQIESQIAEAESDIKKLPAESTFTIVQVLFGASMLLSIVFGVFLFRPNLKSSKTLLVASILLLLATYFISPDIDGGKYSGFSRRTLALITGIPLIVVALFAFWIAKKKNAESLRSGR
ncbi:hypothetical protein [uncultured Flavobacterium sp.]|jgi:uncharacterized protein YfcZ (UPF0381/DUF406 family)|uniref:hypothetical protein n=1 Tax=uncultured Flavobacterium sp. TaxID=165435 RepID=UPI0012140649|nr:hypothetical protein [uncultured Flavobacterium sp.]THD29988.1 MAG: hypothetical protein DI588_17605 [Flavobacterium johnsoniae]